MFHKAPATQPKWFLFTCQKIQANLNFVYMFIELSESSEIEFMSSGSINHCTKDRFSDCKPTTLRRDSHLAYFPGKTDCWKKLSQNVYE